MRPKEAWPARLPAPGPPELTREPNGERARSKIDSELEPSLDFFVLPQVQRSAVNRLAIGTDTEHSRSARDLGKRGEGHPEVLGAIVQVRSQKECGVLLLAEIHIGKFAVVAKFQPHPPVGNDAVT